MRGSYLSDECILDEEKDIITLKGEECDHLIVTRLREGDDLLVLDGQGNIFQTKVVGIQKKKWVSTKIIKKVFSPRLNKITIGLGFPKREAFERAIQIGQEFSIESIIPFECEFSQFKSFKEDRLKKILIGALKQSNSPYLCHLKAMQKFETIPWEQFDRVIYLYLYAQKEDFQEELDLGKEKIMLLVGPEGGFSPDELALIDKIENLSRLKICDTILRVETCVASALGYLHYWYGRK